MRRLTHQAAACLMAAAITSLSLLSGPANADPSGASTVATVAAIRVDSQSADLSTGRSIELTFDDPLTVPEAEQALTTTFGISASHLDGDVLVGDDDQQGEDEQVAMRSSTTSLASRKSGGQGVVVVGDGDGSPAPIYCDEGNAWSDADGTFSLQRACGSDKAPWTFYLSAGLQSICVDGTYIERGMKWVLNGVTKPMQAAHLAGTVCYYKFHGTFTVSKGDLMSYNDVVSFHHNVGSGGTATLTIYGNVQFKGNR